MTTTKAKGGSHETLKQMNRRHATEFKKEIEAGHYTEHEQPAPEGEEWHSVNMTDTAFDNQPVITIEQGDKLLATAHSPEAAEAILRNHRLAALVPGLEAALRELLDCETNLAGCSGVKLLDAVDAARAVLNAVTKERER